MTQARVGLRPLFLESKLHEHSKALYSVRMPFQREEYDREERTSR